MDRCKWRKMIKDVRWSGWVWVGECFFWYRPTRVVPDKRPLNGCVRVCGWRMSVLASDIGVFFMGCSSDCACCWFALLQMLSFQNLPVMCSATLHCRQWAISKQWATLYIAFNILCIWLKYSQLLKTFSVLILLVGYWESVWIKPRFLCGYDTWRTSEGEAEGCKMAMWGLQ